MDIINALKHGSLAEHRSGKATVLAFKDMEFSLLTVNGVTFVIQDLEETTAINGVQRDPDQAKAFAAKLSREAGISFERGWRSQSRSCWTREKLASVVALCLMSIYLVRQMLVPFSTNWRSWPPYRQREGA